ncbi:hypothetical protein BDQ17DRAFT_1345355 [Cyathus striatus]|nr:hypothetical protein BDQ17DRAFT_1345355 [Cyathus striatus]
MFRALLYAYILGGLTFIPLLVGLFIFVSIYTSVPVGDADATKKERGRRAVTIQEEEESSESEATHTDADTNDIPRTRKGWLTMRRTFEESPTEGGYVNLVRSLLDSRSKDPKRSKPKDMCHDVIVYPEGLPDGELFAKRNAICLRPKVSLEIMPSLTKEMKFEEGIELDAKLNQDTTSGTRREKEREQLLEAERKKEVARQEAMDVATPWFIFVRSNVEMEDWYFSLIHASDYPRQTPTLYPLRPIFEPADMNHLVSTLDDQPDVIPMRWLNALLGRIFFSYYRTHRLEAYIIGRLMKKLSKVKRPTFLSDIVVTDVSVGNKAPMFSKPMLKELTKEGDASLEVHVQYKGEIRITVEATAVINLGARFKSSVKLVLAAVLKELEGNLLVKVKRPPSNRIWYAFTQTPRMVLEVEPIVSDRQITWNMILSTIESKFKEIIQESVVMPNMDDIAFFESMPYQHRGGIWPDASRKSPSSASETSSDDLSVASAPVPDVTLTSDTNEVVVPQRSQSGDEIISTDITSLSVTDSNTTKPSVEESLGSQTASRRRTWFSSTQNDEVDVILPPTFIVEEPQDAAASGGDISRGRPAQLDKPPSGRSQSNPSSVKAESIHSSTTAEDSDQSEPPVHLFPQSTRRSSSQHSTKRAEESLGQNRSPSAPATPRKVSTSSQDSNGNRASSPTSFFSTLKSKAADKQAISNTAKEAMRKWGVNWSGFKKDTNSNQPTTDEPSDAGLASQLRLDDTNVSCITAVAERKEREEKEKGHRTEAGSAAPNDTSGSRSSTEADTNSFLSNRKSNPSIARTNNELDESFSVSDDPPHRPPIHVQPQAKTMSIPGIHASHRGEVMSMGYVAPQPAPNPASESKIKNPAIQSVYRLWKNPPGSSSHEQGSQSGTPLPAEGETKDKTVDNTSQTSVKPIPPPLPPRSTPVAISRLPVDSSLALAGDSSPPPSASDALKSIASKDESTRLATLDQIASQMSNRRLSTSREDVVENSEVGSVENSQGSPGQVPNVSGGAASVNQKPPALPPRRIPPPSA